MSQTVLRAPQRWKAGSHRPFVSSFCLWLRRSLAFLSPEPPSLPPLLAPPPLLDVLHRQALHWQLDRRLLGFAKAIDARPIEEGMLRHSSVVLPVFAPIGCAEPPCSSQLVARS